LANFDYSLGDAIATVQRDPRWLQKVLLHGALALSLLGLPLAVGFVMESYDNSRKGYPTPLPPWSDWTTRALIGFFASLIDVAFFALPFVLGGMLSGAAALIALTAGQDTLIGPAIATIMSLAALLALTFFLCSVSPIARLLYATDGRIEDALTRAPLTAALAHGQRAIFFAARVRTLLAYLPAALCAALLVLLSRVAFSGQVLVIVLGLWLTFSAIVFAHLVVAQVYIAAEREIAQRAFERQ
jgi:hypothetical protein